MRRAEVYGRFWKFWEISQSCKMLQLGVQQSSSAPPVSTYVCAIVSGKILYKCDESLLTVPSIVASRLSEK